MSDPAEELFEDDFEGNSPDDALERSAVGGFTDWEDVDLEAAYLKAVMALEASDAELPPIPVRETTAAASDTLVAAVADRSPDAELNRAAKVEQAKTELAELMSEAAQNRAEKPASELSSDVRLNPRQILEACLFVGGSPLASGKLANVLRGDYDSEFVDREIDELNRLYAAENRPYEIRLGEGGYRLSLRDEFQRIRYKVYGLGPKEVRLSQESLEVLAIVAYYQPIKQAAVEEMGKPNCGAVLRQLVRRELLAVERDPEQPRDVFYKTTPRFLSLFGIRNLSELPRHEQVGYK